MPAKDKQLKVVKTRTLKKSLVLARAKTAKRKSAALKTFVGKPVVKKIVRTKNNKSIVSPFVISRVKPKAVRVPVRVVNEAVLKAEIFKRHGLKPQANTVKPPLFKKFLSKTVYNTAVVLIPVLVLLPLFQAFEAHIINTTAALAQIDPPVLTPPGDIGWNNTDGGNYASPINVEFSDSDSDATHIFYTVGLGTDPDVFSDPYCGGPNGGLKNSIPPLPVSQTSVVKAVACDGDSVGSHFSLINIKIYQFAQADLCEPINIDFPENTALMAAGPNDSFGDIYVSANVTVNGQVKGNHNLEANGGGANRNINGDVTVSGSIESSNFTISGSANTGSAAQDMPVINNAFWQDKANDGGTVLGSLVIPGSSGIIDLGPSEIMGNLEIGNNNIVNVHGTLYVHGNLKIDSNVVINQDPAFADSFGVIIVEGVIDIRANVAFNGAGTKGTFLLISTSLPKSGDDAAIETESNNSDLGDVVLFAQSGDVHINSNRTLLAIYAKEGTSLTGPAIDLDSNVTVNFRPLPSVISCGPVFSPLNQLLINEFLPNPSGSDQGSVGGSLDGEFVEIYNGSSTPLSLEGYVLYDDFLPPGSAQNKTWTSNSDFASSSLTSNLGISSSSVVFSSGVGSGTLETVLDAGEGNRADWQNLTWTESNSLSGNVCIQAATSNDGVNFSAFSACDDISGMDLNAAGLPDSRYLKWQAIFTRADVLHNARLDSLSATYNLYNYHELFIKPENTNTGTTTVAPGGFLVVYREGDTDFDLDNDGTDTVKLYNGHFWQGASLVDQRTYDYGASVPDNKSFTRMPDGTNNWIDPDPSPGESNDEFIDSNTAPSASIVFDSEPSEEEAMASAVPDISLEPALNQEPATEPAEPEIIDTKAADEETVASDLTQDAQKPALTEEEPNTPKAPKPDEPVKIEESPEKPLDEVSAAKEPEQNPDNQLVSEAPISN